MGYSFKHSSPLCPCGWLNPHKQRSQKQGAWGLTLQELEHLWSLVSAGGPGTNLLMEAEGQLYKGFRIWLYLCSGVGVCCLPFLIHSHFAQYQVPQLLSHNPHFSESCKVFRQNYLHLFGFVSANVTSACQIINSLPLLLFHRGR